jgi:hypothetical protein
MAFRLRRGHEDGCLSQDLDFLRVRDGTAEVDHVVKTMIVMNFSAARRSSPRCPDLRKRTSAPFADRARCLEDLQDPSPLLAEHGQMKDDWIALISGGAGLMLGTPFWTT